MEVDRVKVSLKYSQVLASGNTKTVELEASGTVSPKETWQQAQAYLYAELEKQVMEVFKLPEAKLEAPTIRPTPAPPMGDPNDPERIFQKPSIDPRGPQLEQPMGGQLPVTEAPMDGPLGHWCVDHAQKFEKHQKGSSVWYSHKIEGTEEWCREE